jgi:hypothetical protein
MTAMTQSPQSVIPENLPHAAGLLNPFLDISQRLAILLDAEVRLLQERDRARYADLVTEKNRLTLEYDRARSLLLKETDELRTLDDSDRDALRKSSRLLDTAVNQNAQRLSAETRVHQRFVSAIMDEIRKTHAPQTYSNPQDLGPSGSYQAEPLTLDRKI